MKAWLVQAHKYTVWLMEHNIKFRNPIAYENSVYNKDGVLNQWGENMDYTMNGAGITG